MNTGEVTAALKNLIYNKKQCCIWRTGLEDYPIRCIPLAVSKYFILIAVIDDFLIDGYQVIRLEDVTCVERGDTEVFLERVFLSENIEVNRDNLLLGHMDSMQDMFTVFLNSKKHISIENETEEQFFFYIGIVLEVTDQYIDFIDYDEMGIWRRNSERVFYKDITCISFKSNYINVLSKYTRKEM